MLSVWWRSPFPFLLTHKGFIMLRKHYSRFTAVALTSLAATTFSGAALATTLGDVDACFNGSLNAGVSGIAAGIAVDGNVVYNQGFGTVAPASSQAVGVNTRFRIGSTAKAMTAAAVMSLVDQGLISLSDRVIDIFPSFSVPSDPGWVNNLTIGSLLTHQGAIRDGGTIDGPREDSDLAGSWADPNFQQQFLMWNAPNKFWNYSNAHFSIAGLMAEVQGGNFYRTVMQNRVFGPLGMSRTAFRPDEVTQDNDYALGISGQDVLDADAYDNAVLRPAGWTWSTVSDLLAFARFIKDGNTGVLSSGSWQAMRSPQINTRRFLDRESYGYGLYVLDYVNLNSGFYDGATSITHGGNLPGYTSRILVLPNQGFAMAIVGNGTNLNFNSCIEDAIQATVAARLPAPTAFPDLEIDTAKFADYAGTYYERSGSLGGLFIVSNHIPGQLNIQFPVLDALAVPYDPVLQPLSRDNFIFTIQGGQLLMTGIRDGGTSIRYLRTRGFVGDRLGSPGTGGINLNNLLNDTIEPIEIILP